MGVVWLATSLDLQELESFGYNNGYSTRSALNGIMYILLLNEASATGVLPG